MELDSDHVNGRCATVTGVVEEISAHSDSCAVGVLLLRMIICTDLHIHDIPFAVVWDVLALHENDSVGTFADSGDALSEMSKFLCVGFTPQFLVLWVHQYVLHFHEVAQGFVKDSVEHVQGELP